MADAETRPDGSRAPLCSNIELGGLWDEFRSGGAIACPTDSAPIALVVDASASVYRFACTQCGSASAWFEATLDDLVVREDLSLRDDLG
jgi:hypothetical protein